MAEKTPKAVRMTYTNVYCGALQFQDGYGTKLELPIRDALLTPLGATVLQEVLAKIEQLTSETI